MSSKRPLATEDAAEPSTYGFVETPAKKAKLILDSDDSSDEAAEEGDTKSSSRAGERSVILSVNKEFANRFEHNKKREERQRLEEKYGKVSLQVDSRDGEEELGSSESSSDAESEDDDGELATERLDAEISAALQAIRSKEPRVYDQSATFYSEAVFEELNSVDGKPKEKEKSMSLRDYHRLNVLNRAAADEEDEEAPQTYVQEQAELKSSILREISAAEQGSQVAESERGEDDFLTRKASKSIITEQSKVNGNVLPDLDVESADKDPETFLSKFISSRAWVAGDTRRFQPFESDDEEEEARADAFEEAYNLRFEDPERANERIITHARDATAKHSVRREELSGRRKARDAQRMKRDQEKLEREEEKRRLRKLKIEEMEDRVKKIRDAAGLRGKSVSVEEWSNILEQDWDDSQWDTEMKRRFGEKYYAESDREDLSDQQNTESRKKKKVKKPKWQDDIDITDIVPDFQGPADTRDAFAFSDDDGGVAIPEADKEPAPTAKDDQKQRAADRRAARLERRRIEELVDASLDLNVALNSSTATLTKKAPSQFRYRETSPSTFGLTARDILMAEDSQLNQYAGLKKLSAFRDPDKKRKDKKKLGKKARLRQWRLESFGNPDGPTKNFGEYIADKAGVNVDHLRNKSEGTNLEGEKPKHRSKSRERRKLQKLRLQ